MMVQKLIVSYLCVGNCVVIQFAYMVEDQDQTYELCVIKKIHQRIKSGKTNIIMKTLKQEPLQQENLKQINTMHATEIK